MKPLNFFQKIDENDVEKDVLYVLESGGVGVSLHRKITLKLPLNSCEVTPQYLRR